ncbi:MAG: hypothetical protein H9802_12795 [Candidatus Phocaeicola faecipullorum]|nr:hypothetical protein [Candidatus Phocaeicola faecipullorum]
MDQPVKKDSTDNNVVQIKRFRKRVWLMIGNSLGAKTYRFVFPVAFIYRSIMGVFMYYSIRL